MADYNLAGPDGKTVRVAVFPGDLVQIMDPVSAFYAAVATVTETARWGVGATVFMPGGMMPVYQRLKPRQFWPVGTAAMMPPDVAKARAAAIETDRLLKSEQGAEQ